MTYYYEPAHDNPSYNTVFNESASLLPLPLLQPIHDHYSRYRQQLILLIVEFTLIAICYLSTIIWTVNPNAIGVIKNTAEPLSLNKFKSIVFWPDCFRKMFLVTI